MSGEILALGRRPRLASSARAARAPAAAQVAEVADAARVAALAFLAGVRSGFDKQTLAAWLVDPYRRATALGAARMAGRRFSSATPPAIEIVNAPSASREPIRHDRLDELLHRSRLHVLAALEAASRGRTRPAFVQQAIARAEVVSLDLGGVIGFFPRDVPRLRLRERVLSLFAADYLARPSSYTEELLVCPWCEGVRFDAAARERGTCGDHGRASGIVSKGSNAGSTSGERPCIRPLNDGPGSTVEEDEESGDGYTQYLRHVRAVADVG